MDHQSKRTAFVIIVQENAVFVTMLETCTHRCRPEYHCCAWNRAAAAAAKEPGDQLFEEINANDLNDRLKELMEGLSVKVFRTYNASITLDRLLWEQSLSKTVEEKKADYDLANKEVCLSPSLCCA